ncbi:hypothetical protein H5410_035813 [Solanum commersonii]|uniref:RNase H type-1 domain-containing protein n=1 Tax=Solanum commersonii TaxID=4109 RepID=A0A9J5Y2Y7_SOLCO|nr:hypothetical protein H5410_035813 [Solanum commersonii]
MAIWKTLKYCLSHDISNIKLETDSLNLKFIIIGEWKIPWEMVEKIEEIIELMGQLNFHNFSQLASMETKVLNIDKSGVPTIRIKTRMIVNRQGQA